MPKNKQEWLTPTEYSQLADVSLVIQSEYLHWPGIDTENQIVWVGIFATMERPIENHLDKMESLSVITYRYPDTAETPYMKYSVKNLVDAILLSRKLTRQYLVTEVSKMRKALEAALQEQESLDVIHEKQSKLLKAIPAIN